MTAETAIVVPLRDCAGRLLYAIGKAMHDAGLALCGLSGEWDARTDAKVWADQYGRQNGREVQP